jgi:aspartyl-tRNA(Asn)/glutamyl-tRNA(Gln) amidotransferase subunit B
MEEGSLRCDANVSVRPRGEAKLGTKVEIKNLNSFRFLQKALDYEIERQTHVLQQGGRIEQETRLWDEGRAATFLMRSKEEAHDYRYFPEPDLPPLVLDPAWIAELERSLPELPGAKVERFVAEYQLSADDALQLAATSETAAYFEACARDAGNPRAAANWIMGEVAYALKASGKEIDKCPVPPARLAALVALVEAGTISGKIAKTVFEEMFAAGRPPGEIVSEKGLVQITDERAVAAIIDKVVAENPSQVAQYRSGKSAALGWFVGQVMKASQGKANPALVNRILKERLG